MEPKRTLVLLANTTMKQVWLGEAAMRGDIVHVGTRLSVGRKNGDVEHGYVLSGIPAQDELHVRQCGWADEVDLSRCHPVPSGGLADWLGILLANGKVKREQEAKR